MLPKLICIVSGAQVIFKIMFGEILWWGFGDFRGGHSSVCYVQVGILPSDLTLDSDLYVHNIQVLVSVMLKAGLWWPGRRYGRPQGMSMRWEGTDATNVLWSRTAQMLCAGAYCNLLVLSTAVVGHTAFLNVNLYISRIPLGRWWWFKILTASGNVGNSRKSERY